MANIYDQFDAPQATGNPYDQFDTASADDMIPRPRLPGTASAAPQPKPDFFTRELEAKGRTLEAMGGAAVEALELNRPLGPGPETRKEARQLFGVDQPPENLLEEIAQVPGQLGVALTEGFLAAGDLLMRPVNAAIQAPIAGISQTAKNLGLVREDDETLSRDLNFALLLMGAGAPTGAVRATAGRGTGQAQFGRLMASRAPGAQRRAARILAKDLQDTYEGLSAEEAIARAERVVTQRGGVLMDAGRRLAQRAGDVARPGGKPGEIIDTFLIERQVGRTAPSGMVRGGAAERAGGILDDVTQTQSGTAARRSMKAQQKGQSQALYEKTANDPANLVTGPEYTAVAVDPYVADTVRKVRASKLHGMKDAPDNSLPVIDATQKRMSDAAGAALRQGKNNEARLISEKRQALVEAADKAFPDYARAREVWRDHQGVLNADDLGRKFMRGDVDVLEDAVGRMKPAEFQQFRAGATRAVRDEIMKKKRGGDVSGVLLGTPQMEARARLAFGDQYRKVFTRMTGERVKYQSFAEAFGNSKTAERIARLEQQGIDIAELAGAAGDVMTGNKLGLVKRAVKIMGKQRQPGKATRKEMAIFLTGKDFKALRDALGVGQPGRGVTPPALPGAGTVALPASASAYTQVRP